MKRGRSGDNDRQGLQAASANKLQDVITVNSDVINVKLQTSQMAHQPKTQLFYEAGVEVLGDIKFNLALRTSARYPPGSLVGGAKSQVLKPGEQFR